ncbi:unnamed protein product, partial [Mesorhabditis belari]|uniref:Tyrosine-protein phosphatase domain-containing protein n=1 Tax=Mesorhabditis belari TaxID=2138241 RepID=A0AAF3F735_9BILA
MRRGDKSVTCSSFPAFCRKTDIKPVNEPYYYATAVPTEMGDFIIAQAPMENILLEWYHLIWQQKVRMRNFSFVQKTLMESSACGGLATKATSLFGAP